MFYAAQTAANAAVLTTMGTPIRWTPSGGVQTALAVDGSALRGVYDAAGQTVDFGGQRKLTTVGKTLDLRLCDFATAPGDGDLFDVLDPVDGTWLLGYGIHSGSAKPDGGWVQVRLKRMT